MPVHSIYVTIVNQGIYHQQTAVVTHRDDDLLRVTPIDGDPLVSIELKDTEVVFPECGHEEGGWCLWEGNCFYKLEHKDGNGCELAL